ncbi:MAG TPA: hypothetical protein VMU69_09650 [Bradyrhizobium sp.]|nr:hypothetical protein [Bradyrhizobium sp.]
MHGPQSRDYLSDEFLDRVRRSYVLHARSRKAGRCWGLINRRRHDIDVALLADSNLELREIFADPASTELYYGVDNLCHSIAPVCAEDFTTAALTNFRGQVANYLAGQVLAAAASPNAPVVEIGPGMGRVAYLAYSRGLTDYTTIDLPLGVVAQACFLGRVLRPDQIWFQGEPNEDSTDCIKLLYAHQLPQRRYSVALNVDSLPEMPATIAFEYACWLSTHADLFLSTNQEHLGVFSVSEVVAFACSVKPHARKECAIWPGYFEEAYSFAGASPRFSTARRKTFELLAVQRQAGRSLGLIGRVGL